MRQYVPFWTKLLGKVNKMPEIHLPDAVELPAGDPQATFKYQGPDGRQHMVVDTRPPLYRMRRPELAKLASQRGFYVTNERKDDLIRMLEAPQSVIAQLNGNRNLAQAKQAAIKHNRGDNQNTNVGPSAMMARHSGNKNKEPEEWEIEADKKLIHAELMGMPFFSFRKLMRGAGVSIEGGREREDCIAEYLRVMEGVKEDEADVERRTTASEDGSGEASGE